MRYRFSIFFIFLISIVLIDKAWANQNLNVANPFLGTWKLISITRDTIPSSNKTNSFGPHPEGYLTYSSDGRMMVIIVQNNRLTPKGQILASSEAAALFKTMNSYAGTYTIKHDCIIHHIDISWNQKWTGTDQVRYYKFYEKHLFLSTPPKPNPQTGKPVIDTLLWEKIS